MTSRFENHPIQAIARGPRSMVAHGQASGGGLDPTRYVEVKDAKGLPSTAAPGQTANG